MTRKDNQRRFSTVRRIVVKCGSSLFFSGNRIHRGRLDRLTATLSELRTQNRELVLVSSGAVAFGRRRFKKFAHRPTLTLPEKQALAALGQPDLLALYRKLFTKYGVDVAQVLVTREGLQRRAAYVNARQTLAQLLAWGVLPIINENDTVAVEELRFGDNDRLSAVVADLTDSELLIVLTDIDGFYTGDPDVATSRRLSVIKEITPNIEAMAGATGNVHTVGGMAAKLSAVKHATQSGVPVIIADGRNPTILFDILQGADVGTFFPVTAPRLTARKRWLLSLEVQGAVIIDAGAVRALVRGKKSLLPSGVTGVSGDFARNAFVEVRDPSGSVVATGISNYSASEVRQIQGRNTAELATTFDRFGYTEVIHRDNLL